MSARLREDFEAQCLHARMVSGFGSSPVSVIIRKYPGERAWFSVIGAAISWGGVAVWCEQEGMRYRVLRVYRGGAEVPRPHRVGRLP